MKHIRSLRVLVVLACALGITATRAGEITVSAAASLTNAFRDIAPLFEAAHPGVTVHLNFAASGALLAQITKGAPVDVFASADPLRMNLAQARNLVQTASRRNFALNALVVITPASVAQPPRSIHGLAQPGVRRIAIGLPASVPVGSYTRDVLEAARLWQAIEPRMIGASSVRQVLDYVARGEVDAGFVYATDAALMPGKVKLAFTVPTPQPIVYPVAVLAEAPNPVQAARFVDFLFTPAARAVLASHGFGRP